MKPILSMRTGIFGAGSLGRTLGAALRSAGMPAAHLKVCHKGSAETASALRLAGLWDCTTTAADVCRDPEVLLYTVPPPAYRALSDYSLPGGCLLISMVAGISRRQLPVSLPPEQRIRIMPSTPDTFRKGQGIAAVYPAGNAIVEDLLKVLGIREIPLQQEDDLHAFTSMVLCLPMALMYAEAAGQTFDPADFVETAEKHGLERPQEMLAWAQSVQERDLPSEIQIAYLQETISPGGITEIVLRSIDEGAPITEALENGIARSRKLAAGST